MVREAAGVPDGRGERGEVFFCRRDLFAGGRLIQYAGWRVALHRVFHFPRVRMFPMLISRFSFPPSTIFLFMLKFFACT